MTVERIPVTSREQWLELRRHDVTASDVAAVLGLSPYKTPLRVWAEKTGRAKEGQENAAMRRGRWLEGAVIHALEEERLRWAITNLRSSVYLRDSKARIGATPDAVAASADGEIIIQCKVVARPVFDSWTDGPPLGYQLQTLTEAMLWGAKYAVIAALVIDTFTAELVVFNIERHAEAEQKIRAAAKKFWSDIESGEAPKADYSRDGELLAHLYKPRDEIEPLDLSANNRLPELLEQRRQLKELIKHGEKDCAAMDAEIVEALKGATVGILPGWQISHRIQHRQEVVIAAKSFPVLRVTKKEAAV